MSFFDNARRAFSSKAEDFFDDAEYEQEYEDYEEEPRKSFFSFLSKKNDEDYEEEEYEEPAPARSSYSSSYSRTPSRERYSSDFSRASSSTPAAARTNMNGVELTVHYPETLDDATKIIREVKVNKITVFDISTIASDDEARRVVDYIGGAAEGMDCPFKRLCPSVFCIAPKGVTLDVKKQRY